MSARGSITLGELRGKLEVACHRGERCGRVNLARLIDEHGADTGLPDLWGNLAGDCPNARTQQRFITAAPSTTLSLRPGSCRAGKPSWIAADDR